MNTPNSILNCLLFALLGSTFLAACSGNQHGATGLAARSGFVEQMIPGDPFTHAVFESGLDRPVETELHVYIEGDGIPWDRGRYPSPDPSPRRALAMELMALDPSPSIYLGRPCYFGLATSPGCDPTMWTARRYSPDVIASMSAVVRRYQEKYQVQRLVLIGYSGGGAIAALMAGDLSGQKFLLTIAANLDSQLWTDQHGYLPLEGSINPIDQIDKLKNIPQLHLMGEADQKVPLSVTRSFSSQLDSRASRVYPNFDHACCWVDIWPDLLAEQPWGKGDSVDQTATLPEAE